MVMLSQVQPKAATGVDDELFLLDGFDEEEGLYGVEGVDGESAGGNGGNPLEERGNPMAFPQSDDEEISTDGESVYDCAFSACLIKFLAFLQLIGKL